MDSKEIVRRLVVGSEAIDRMRQEINSVVSIVLGFVIKKHEIEDWREEFSKRFKIDTFWSLDFPGCTWHFIRNSGRPAGKGYLETECCLNTGFGEVRFKREFGKFDIPYRNVQRVYESLPLFVEGMRKLFPFLEDCWQPFLDASDYTEREERGRVAEAAKQTGPD